MKDISFVTITCAKDLHYAKCLLGSIRHYYPSHPIIVIADDDITDRHIVQLQKFQGITIHRSHALRELHGMPLTGLLTKLNLLFIPGLEKCMVMDADSILVGTVLDYINEDDEMVAFDGKMLDLSNAKSYQSFNKYAISLEDLKPIDPEFTFEKVIYMNSGHFFLEIKRFPVEEVQRNISYMNNNFAHTGAFRFGDQGFINYVVNKYDGKSLKTRYMDMCILGKYPESDVPDISIKSIKARASNSKCIIHYTAPSRKQRIADHNFGEIMRFYEDIFYANLPDYSLFYDRIERGISLYKKKANNFLKRNFKTR